MTVRIVRAEKRHLADIGKLWWEFMLFHENGDPIFGPREGSIPGFLDNGVRRLMKTEDGLVLVALEEGEVVGFSLSEIRLPSTAYKRGKYGAIDTVAITASYRRRGIGEKVLGEIMGWFQSKGVDRVGLETSARNAVSNSFWGKHGFRVYRHRLFRELK